MKVYKVIFINRLLFKKEIIPQEYKELIDLLDKMFEVDPTKRISCKEALNHEFFK